MFEGMKSNASRSEVDNALGIRYQLYCQICWEKIDEVWVSKFEGGLSLSIYELSSSRNGITKIDGRCKGVTYQRQRMYKLLDCN